MNFFSTSNPLLDEFRDYFTGTQSPISDAHKSDSSAQQTAHDQISGNSLRAFTGAVDALALQTSVLGNVQ